MPKAKDYSLNIWKQMTENVTEDFEFWNNTLNLPESIHIY